MWWEVSASLSRRLYLILLDANNMGVIPASVCTEVPLSVMLNLVEYWFKQLHICTIRYLTKLFLSAFYLSFLKTVEPWRVFFVCLWCDTLEKTSWCQSCLLGEVATSSLWNGHAQSDVSYTWRCLPVDVVCDIRVPDVSTGGLRTHTGCVQQVFRTVPSKSYFDFEDTHLDQVVM